LAKGFFIAMIVLMLHLLLLFIFFAAHSLFLKRYLCTEMRIFVFSCGLFAILPLITITVVWQWLGPIFFTTWLIVYGVSAVYALSFLEVWSLTQGSYSLQLLQAMNANAPVNPFSIGSAIGHEKQGSRIEGMVRLGLMRDKNGRLEISFKGRIVALFTELLVLPAGVKLRE
jgi:hypothetical protein